MFAIWAIIIHMVVYYSMFVEHIKWASVFSGTNWVVMFVWWLFLPGSQFTFFLGALDGDISPVNVLAVVIVALAEMVALAVKGLND